MKFENVSILSLAHVDAPHRVTSDEIGERLKPTLSRYGLPTSFIRRLTGINARRFWDSDISFSEVAAMAGEKALKAAGIDRARIGVLISTSVCKDYLEPSMACLVHRRLGLSPECINFDLANACLAFINGMQVIGHMIERGQVDYGLVVDGEGSLYTVEKTIERLLSPDIDEQTLRDNFATLTLGSGAGAMVLARSDLAPDDPRLGGAVSLAATEYNHLCLGKLDQMITDAQGLLMAGLDLAIRTWELAGRELGWSDEVIDHYITHQVSAPHTNKFMQHLNLTAEKFYFTFPEYGNIGPAALPITLSKAVEAGRIRKGQRVALMGIGSGINCSMMEVVW